VAHGLNKRRITWEVDFISIFTWRLVKIFLVLDKKVYSLSTLKRRIKGIFESLWFLHF